jgi:myo-inositol-1(or 4)-monophosphatase
MAYEKEYEFAKKLAVEVGAYIAEQQEKKHTITEKGNKELCTETDIGSEKRIIAGIRSTFPDDTILAEESQNELHEETERLWIVDPIDGTHQFANGEDNYAILISFVVKGKAVVGVACQPNVKKLYHAKKGEGAWCNEREIRTTEEKDLKKLLVIKALWYDREENKLDEGLAVLKKMMENCLDERRYGSCGIDCTRVASGKAGAYYEFSLKQVALSHT